MGEERFLQPGPSCRQEGAEQGLLSDSSHHGTGTQRRTEGTHAEGKAGSGHRATRGIERKAKVGLPGVLGYQGGHHER